MTDEQRKQIEKTSEEYAEKHSFRVPYNGSQDYYNDVDYKASAEGFSTGAEFGLSLSVKRVKELEDVLKSVEGWLKREDDLGKLGSIGWTLLDMINKTLTPPDNDKSK